MFMFKFMSMFMYLSMFMSMFMFMYMIMFMFIFVFMYMFMFMLMFMFMWMKEKKCLLYILNNWLCHIQSKSKNVKAYIFHEKLTVIKKYVIITLICITSVSK